MIGFKIHHPVLCVLVSRLAAKKEGKFDEKAYSTIRYGWNRRIRHFIFLRRWKCT
jgi:hypothetical protein